MIVVQLLKGKQKQSRHGRIPQGPLPHFKPLVQITEHIQIHINTSIIQASQMQGCRNQKQSEAQDMYTYLQVDPLQNMDAALTQNANPKPHPQRYLAGYLYRMYIIFCIARSC